MLIKICGLQPKRDVKLCIDLGVNFLGFVFYEKSPRNLKLEDVKKLKEFNKKNSHYVAVTVNPSNEFIKKVVLGNFDYIQLHGSETSERVKEIKTMGLKIIKAIKLKNELSINDYKKYSQYFEEDILNLGLETAIQSRNSVGGTAKSIVEKALSKAKKEIKIATDHYEKN